jgi:hypothetical protein
MSRRGNRRSARIATVAPAGGGDVVAPTLASVATNTAGTTVTLTYDEALDAGSQPATAAYTLGGTASTVASLNVTGSTVVLTLNTAAYRHETITLTYVVPGLNPVQDAAGNDAAAFAAQAVTNNITARATDPLAIITSKTNVFFLSGDLGITEAAGAVSAWANQGPTGATGDATQATGANQPTYNAAGLNGRGTVAGDGSNDCMVFAGGLDLPDPDITPTWFLFVWIADSWTISDSLFAANGTTALRLRQDPTTPNMNMNNAVTGANNAGAVLSTWVRGEALFGNTVGDYLKLGATSTVIPGTATGGNNPVINVFTLFAHTTAAAGAINGKLATIAAWNGNPTAGEKTLTDAWVTARYGGSVGV